MDNNIHDMPFLIPCIYAAAVVILLIMLTVPEESEDITLGTYEAETVPVEYFDDIPVEETVMESETETIETETEEETVEMPYISDEELDLLAKCVMAEAGNQEELGKRLVIDVILNRVDCELFADQNTISDVIFAKGQFQVVSNGTIHKYTPTDDIYDLIREELMNRTNQDVAYFRTGKYHSVGKPYDKVGDHYFSTLKEGLE
jgi:N-acetylmuramoyl-L-alanine amidase